MNAGGGTANMSSLNYFNEQGLFADDLIILVLHRTLDETSINVLKDYHKHNYLLKVPSIWFDWFDSIDLIRLIWFDWFISIDLIRLIWFDWFDLIDLIRLIWFDWFDSIDPIRLIRFDWSDSIDLIDPIQLIWFDWSDLIHLIRLIRSFSCIALLVAWTLSNAAVDCSLCGIRSMWICVKRLVNMTVIIKGILRKQWVKSRLAKKRLLLFID